MKILMPRSLANHFWERPFALFSTWPPPPATAPPAPAAVACAGMALTLDFAVPELAKLLVRSGDEAHAPTASATTVHANIADLAFMDFLLAR
ncbi:MAG TPA: hypothetical protein VFP36_11650 [Usitatibacter sp.]|nr:hypothetical protein [Usitatibacter sp.]